MNGQDRLRIALQSPHAYEWTSGAGSRFTGSEGTVAPCATHEADWFDPKDAETCKAVCLTCPHRVKCASVFLEQKPAAQHFGVWAGFDMSRPDDRAAFRRWWGK